MTIKGLPKDTSIDCIHCCSQATWLINLGCQNIYLCDDCCNKLSILSGDIGDFKKIMNKLGELVDAWRERS